MTENKATQTTQTTFLISHNILENVTREEGHYSLFNIVDFYKKKIELHIASMR